MKPQFKTFLIELTIDFDLDEGMTPKKIRELFERLDSAVYGVITVDTIQEVGE